MVQLHENPLWFADKGCLVKHLHHAWLV